MSEIDKAIERIVRLMAMASMSGGEIIIDTDDYIALQTAITALKAQQDGGWHDAEELPTENGVYLILCEFYKDKSDRRYGEVEWCEGEWKITDTWNLIRWQPLPSKPKEANHE